MILQSKHNENTVQKSVAWQVSLNQNIKSKFYSGSVNSVAFLVAKAVYIKMVLIIDLTADYRY